MPQPLDALLSDVLSLLEEFEDAQGPLSMGEVNHLSTKAHHIGQRLRAHGVEPAQPPPNPGQASLPLEVSVDDAEEALEDAMADL
jgi:hypothetical protein